MVFGVEARVLARIDSGFAAEDSRHYTDKLLAIHLITANFFRSMRLTHSCNSFGS